MLPLNPDLAATFRPPVMEARRWLEGVSFPPDRPLINVSQAAPVDPPPEGLRRAIAEAALDRPEAHLYGPVLGNGELREAVKGNDKEAIEAKTQALTEASAKLAERAYAKAGAAEGPQAGAGEAGADGDVVDAEFTEVKDDKK